MNKKKNTLLYILLSLFCFVILWAIVTDAWGYSSHISGSYGKYIYAIISRLIWVAPAIGLIIHYNEELGFDNNKLFSRPIFNKSLSLVLIVSVAISFIGMIATHGGFWINPKINIPMEILVICFVGFVEETVFRGWGYNVLSAMVSNRKAVILSTVFFVLLHTPAYFVKLYRFGTLDYVTWLTQSLTTAIWGVIFCWLMKKSRTIWNPIIAHIFYDIIVVLFVG